MRGSNSVLQLNFLSQEMSSNLSFIRRRSLSVNGNETLDIGPVRRRVLWINGGEVGKAVLSYVDRCGRPVTVSNDVRKLKVDEFVQANPSIQQKNISSALGSFKKKKSVQHVVSEFEYGRIRAKWAPRILTEETKQSLVDICNQLLTRNYSKTSRMHRR